MPILRGSRYIVLIALVFCCCRVEAAVGNKQWTDEQLIQYLKDWAVEHGHIPSAQDLDAGGISFGTYLRRFGGFAEAKKLAGLYVGEPEMVAHLHAMRERLGRIPLYADLRKPQPRWFSCSRYITVFGSFSKALAAAGMSPLQQRWAGRRAEMLDGLRELALVLGRTPAAREASKNKLPSYQVYAKEFGSWNAAVLAADLSVNDSPRAFRSRGKDGITYDSHLEHQVGAELLKLQITGKVLGYVAHQRVAAERKWTCDFVILCLSGEALWIEVDGLGSNRPDRKCHREKLTHMRSSGFTLLVLRQRGWLRKLHSSVGAA